MASMAARPRAAAAAAAAGGRAPAARAAARAAPRRAAARAAAAGVSIDGVSLDERVAVISEALPYLKRFRGKTIVIKYGGAAMKDESLKASVVADVLLLATVGINIVMVHGGGPEINKWLERVGIEPNFLNGLRVTDDDTMDVAEMVLTGRVNKSIVSLINQQGGLKAVGISGRDSDTLKAKVLNEDLGKVGEITSVDTTLIDALCNAHQIPVIATVATDEETNCALNVNADTAAGEIAIAMGAEKLILMTDVPGIMRDPSDMGTLVRQANKNSLQTMIAEGILQGGMIPKSQCCIRAVNNGVSAAHIIDGRTAHSLLLEVLTDIGGGTMITKE